MEQQRVRSLFPGDPSVAQFIRTLPTLTAKQRKSIVTLCRAQKVPTRREARILSFQAFGSSSGIDAPRNKPNQLMDAVGPVKKYIESPIYSGYILDLARACAPSREELKEIMDNSWDKELNACMTERETSTLNFAAIFDSSRHTEEFIPGVKARPEVNQYIHQLLVDWRDSFVEGQPLYPRMSSKASSRATARLGSQLFPNWTRWKAAGKDKLFSQKVMERILCESGIELEGPCEMRQKLYRAGIVPRTYFAQGGSAYRSSKFLQDPCSKLVDVLPTSNHLLRLIPTNLQLGHRDQHVFIYDLTSFTSLFREFLPFIRQLANLCRGFDVCTWDGFHGERFMDFGDLWDDYADVNASNPSFSVERAGLDTDQFFYHMCAGFLGVYGNLMLCTFLHAVVVLAVIGDTTRCYTAGDDGGVVVMCLLVLEWGTRREDPPTSANHPYDDVAILFYALSLLGIIEWSKVFTTQEEGAIALKRPLAQVEGHLMSPQMVVWPQSILIEMYRHWNSQRDIRFQTYYMFSTRSECRKAVISEVTRFLSHVAAANYRFSDQDLQVVKEHCQWIYNECGLEGIGSVPQFLRRTYSHDFVPDIEGRGGVQHLREDPFRRTFVRHWSGFVYLAARVGDEYKEDQIDLYEGNVFVSRMTRQLSYLCKTGYVSYDSLIVCKTGLESLDLLVEVYTNPSSLAPPLYRFHVDNLPRAV
jgi:hypothetical protein